VSEKADLDHDEEKQVDEIENAHASVIFEVRRNTCRVGSVLLNLIEAAREYRPEGCDDRKGQ